MEVFIKSAQIPFYFTESSIGRLVRDCSRTVPTTANKLSTVVENPVSDFFTAEGYSFRKPLASFATHKLRSRDDFLIPQRTRALIIWVNGAH